MAEIGLYIFVVCDFAEDGLVDVCVKCVCWYKASDLCEYGEIGYGVEYVELLE
jgi:hypothetical protein